MKLLGQGVWQLRLLSALTGILTCVAVFFIGKELNGKALGFTAMFVYSITDFVLRWNHMAFIDYALATLFVATATVLLLQYYKTKSKNRLVLAGVAACLALFSSYYALWFVISSSIALLMMMKPRLKNTLTFFGLAMLPFLAIMGSFWLSNLDLLVMAHVASSASRLQDFASVFPALFEVFLKQNWWILAGTAINILLLLFGGLKRFYAIIFLPLLLLIIASGLNGYILMYIYTTIGFAWLIYDVMRRVKFFPFYVKTRTYLIFIIIVLSAVLFVNVFNETVTSTGYVTNGFPVGNTTTYLVSWSETDQMMEWLNSHTATNDLVMGSSHWLWKLTCKQTDWLHTLNFMGYQTLRPPSKPTDPDVIYSGEMKYVKYAVTEPIVLHFIIGYPESFGVQKEIRDVTETWKPVWQIGVNHYYNAQGILTEEPYYMIYENPNYEGGIPNA